jgi:hypothetical protein
MEPVSHRRLPLASSAELEVLTAWLRRWVELKARFTPTPAAVFDIDATLLVRGRGVIGPVKALFDACEELGVTCFVVTARQEAGRAFTLKELREHGIGGFAHLFMSPNDLPVSSSGRYLRKHIGESKKRARARIAKKGYTIILSAGDAPTDHYAVCDHPRDLEEEDDAARVWLDPDDGCAHLKLLGD